MTKPRCILHIGMPKTGSSSIQETLYHADDIEDCEYLKIGTVSNHSTVIYSLFSNRPELHHAHIAAHRTKNQVEEFVKYQKEQLGRILSSTQSRQYIISGEDILFLQEEELLELRSYLLQFSSEISVVAYVRPPISFMQSAFQQKIKEGDLKFGIAGFYPEYRNRFERFDCVFGRDNVSLIKFHPDSLLAGDVVCDFCNRIGISIDSKNISRVNESISLEAVALLYVFYKFGRDIGCVASMQNHKRAQEFSRFGVRKFQYSKLLADQIRVKIADDIQWMENRLACSLSETIVDDKGISSEEDLITVAFENRDNLAAFITKIYIEPMVTPEDIADVVGRLPQRQYSIKPVFSRTQLLRLESPLVDLSDIVRELILSLGRAGQVKAVNNILCKISDLKNRLNSSLNTNGNNAFFDYLKKRILSRGWFGQIKIMKDIFNSRCFHNKSLKIEPDISCFIDMYHNGCFMGWIVDNNNPLQKLSIEIRQAQCIIARGVAGQFRQDLADAEIGDGCCAFVIKANIDWKNNDGKLFLRVVDFDQEFEIDTISN